MLGALLYLRFTSLANQVRRQVLRLRHPRYLLGMAAVVLYFYFFVFRNLHRIPRTGGAAGGFDPVLVGATVGLLVMMVFWVAGAWVFPEVMAGLRFSAAETAFLFPAPISRRGLIHFSLAGSQLRLLFSAVLLALLRSRHEPSWAGFARLAAGWWFVIATADLHRVGAALTYGRIREGGGSVARARAIATAAVLLVAAAAGWGLWREGRPPGLQDFTGPGLAAYCDELLHAGPLAWLLWPFRIAAGPYLAPDGRAFLLALGPALALVALHYGWVVGLHVSFEESAIAQAEQRAQRLAAWAAGGSALRPGRGPGKARREPFPLSRPGRPEAAFLWKNLLSVGASVPWSRIGMMLLGAAAIVASASSRHAARGPHSSVLPIIVLSTAGMAAFYTFLIGPQLVRQDLRGDLPQMDLLKTYPLAGWQIVGAELLAPMAILSGLLWAALLAALWGLGQLPAAGAFGPATRLAAAACLAALIPLICGLQLLVPNAALLYFPAWHQAGRVRGGGLENMGQRLIFVLAQLVSFVLLLFPGALLGALVFAAAVYWIGAALALPLAALAAAAILAGELWCGLWLLGQRFEAYDLSHESL